MTNFSLFTTSAPNCPICADFQQPKAGGCSCNATAFRVPRPAAFQPKLLTTNWYFEKSGSNVGSDLGSFNFSTSPTPASGNHAFSRSAFQTDRVRAMSTSNNPDSSRYCFIIIVDFGQTSWLFWPSTIKTLIFSAAFAVPTTAEVAMLSKLRNTDRVFIMKKANHNPASDKILICQRSLWCPRLYDDNYSNWMKNNEWRRESDAWEDDCSRKNPKSAWVLRGSGL